MRTEEGCGEERGGWSGEMEERGIRREEGGGRRGEGEGGGRGRRGATKTLIH